MPAAIASGPRVLSLIPPMTQLNVPYPSTAYLTGFLRSRGIAATQAEEQHLSGMRESYATMERSRHDPESFIEADLDFHLLLAEATGGGSQG